MTLTERTRSRVGAELDRLREADGAFDVVEKEWAVGERWYEFTRERARDGALGGAGVWLTDERGAVLLVRREGEDRWEEPGGKHEPGETLEETARREVREETGVRCTVDGVAQVHRIRVALEEDDADASAGSGADDAPPIWRLFVIFRGEHAGGDPRPEEGEIETVRWWEDHPEELHYDEIRRIPIPAAE